MVIGTAKITLKLFGVSSLKGKRKIVKSMISRLKNHYNISAAETDMNESLDWAQIGLAMVGNDNRHINSKLDKILNTADQMGLAMISDTQIEIIHL